MARPKRKDDGGYGKLLDAWTPPEDAGDPIGCVATSFTFSPIFFEEECLTRFLHMESDPTEDGPVYLIEREEKLAQVTCAAALVDQHHCRGGRSLRWDLIPARLPRGLLHAKVSLLYWSQLVRLIVSSANLTEDGYRRNLEVFGVVDFHEESQAPLSCLRETIAFLRKVAASNARSAPPSPAVQRWNGLLERVSTECSTWGTTDDRARRQGVRVRPVFSGPGYENIFDQLRATWSDGSPPDTAYVVSPFFDVPDERNLPAQKLWTLLRQRGTASVHFYVTAESVPGEEAVFLHAPESLLTEMPPGRSSVSTEFYWVKLPEGRPLHAKGIWIENSRAIAYLIGSSNFTSAGTGLGNVKNFEANWLYLVDSRRHEDLKKLLEMTFPDGEHVDRGLDLRWQPRSSQGEDDVGEELTLPSGFGDATYCCDETLQASITFSFAGDPPAQWELLKEGDEQRFFGEHEWIRLGRPKICYVPWTHDRPPSGFWVRWQNSSGAAWWPVNVSSGEALPPPEELKDLPLDMLIHILSSARPLHRVLQDYLRNRHKWGEKPDEALVVDPHKRVDTSQFLLQRTRRVSGALNALRTRLERPVATLEFLRWRLRGPVGVRALAKALKRESKSVEEQAFLISELALVLARVRPEPTPGCLPPDEHQKEIRKVISELRAFIPPLSSDSPQNLREYVQSVFEAIS